jgi:hypothetical protein
MHKDALAKTRRLHMKWPHRFIPYATGRCLKRELVAHMNTKVGSAEENDRRLDLYKVKD